MLTPAAQADINHLADYITNVLNAPNNAINKVKRIKTAIQSLATMPERQALVRHNYLAMSGVRFLPVDNHVIFYGTSNVNVVVIMRVLLNNQDWQHLLV